MFKNSKYYFNRELSWLKFNQRVLQESIDKTNPLLEKLKFIAITSSNLDEFFMIRVAGLQHQEKSGIVKYDAAHMDAKAQLKAIDESAKKLVKVQYGYLNKVLKSLENEGIYFTSPESLSQQSLDWLENYFMRTIYPVVTPLALDSGHPFPFLVNKTINTIVKLQRINGGNTNKIITSHAEEQAQDSSLENKFNIAILPIPSVLDRIIEIPNTDKGKHIFVYLEDVINHFSSTFFVGYEIDSFLTFRVTRDADLEIDEEEAKDLLREVEASLRRRRRGDAVRLEVQVIKENVSDAKCINTLDNDLLHYVMHNLQLDKMNVYMIDGHLDSSLFFELYDIQGYDHLRYEPFEPCYPQELEEADSANIMDAIRKDDIFVHHPFEQFEVVEAFIEQAAKDPNVLAIKQTLYRVSGNSPIIDSLVKAADRGKQVTVLMEVKARFDEENNILMARRLENAGCHVIYGLKGLKTHSKITMVVRRERDAIRRYVHVATGNYNGKTARTYTDVGLFTCNDEYGEDASAFFNLISGFSDPPIWNKFIVSPLNLREQIIENINKEIEWVEQGEAGYIIAKMNSLLDKEIIAKLYEASTKGVKIDLIVRGICTLRPGIPSVSDNIQVRSIVGRFLEHHRLFYFRHGGADTTYISSADWMPRNLNERVELMIPIEGKRHKLRIRNILNLYLADNQKAHIMRADGSYRKLIDKENPIAAQIKMMEMAKKASVKEQLTVIERMQPLYGKK